VGVVKRWERQLNYAATRATGSDPLISMPSEGLPPPVAQPMGAAPGTQPYPPKPLSNFHRTRAFADPKERAQPLQVSRWSYIGISAVQLSSFYIEMALWQTSLPRKQP
jgi:hypothetical protein